MILQALVSYYEALAAKGELDSPGWSKVRVSYALELNADGQIISVIPLKNEEERGKKKVMVPQERNVPTPVKRTVGIAANFLCDNSTYILGIDEKGKPERSWECFQACGELHHTLLDGVEDETAKAILRHFDTWKPEMLSQVISDENIRKEITGGANLVFYTCDGFAQENPMLREAWQSHYGTTDGEQFPCLVTGRMAVPATLHPSIKGVYGGQAMGTTLVGFNAPAFESFERSQGLNAPTGEYAAFAYGAALNYLTGRQRSRIGDTTVLFWAENAQETYADFMTASVFGNFENETYTEDDLLNVVKQLCNGEKANFKEEMLDPNMNFYILGVAPNAARLTVRFFLQDTFGQFLRNVEAHYDRLSIIRTGNDKYETIPLWKLLNETVNQNSRDKMPSPVMAGEVMRSVLNNTRYPATLLNAVEMRIRADKTVNRARAAILKAYYLKNTHPDVPKEVLTVSLNPECKEPAYLLGRLFSVLEALQDAANPGINTTIRDRYFSSASATPSIVFPTLLRLSQNHLGKLDTGKKIYFEKQITEIMNALEAKPFPTHLSLPQQGSFQLGYYHQTAFRYTKKED